MTVVNGKKHKAFEKIQANKATAKADHGETALLKRPKSNSNNDEDEDDDEDDSGNWKRQRKNEYPVAYVF